MKWRISPKSAKPSAFSSKRFSRSAKPAKPAVFGIGESIKHKFRVFQVYRFQNWYQSNTPLRFSKYGIGHGKVMEHSYRRKPIFARAYFAIQTELNVTKFSSLKHKASPQVSLCLKRLDKCVSHFTAVKWVRICSYNMQHLKLAIPTQMSFK